MNVTGKLMHMDCVVDTEDAVELLIVGKGTAFQGGGSKMVDMTVTLRTPRALVKDYKIGDKFDLYVAQEVERTPSTQTEDVYQAGGTAMYTKLVLESMQGEGDDKRVQRQAFKDCFFMALRERMKDPEFRATLKRDIEIADSKK